MRWLKRLLRGAPPEGGDPITCRKAAERLFEYLDGELPDEDYQAVAEHLRTCERCIPRLSFENAFREAVRQAQEGLPAPPEVRKRVRKVLEEEGYRAG